MMAIIALIIVLDSPGAPLFFQERVGKNGRRFRMIKFRTIRCDYDNQADRAFMQAFVAGQIGNEVENHKAIYKPLGKESITRVGRFLRKASLDELPQLFNILKGHMSFIGPRPNVPWEVDAYEDWHYERLNVLPGITGLAQVHGRSSLSFNQIAAYDIEYINNMSLLLDLWIMWRTVWVVLFGNGAG
jgi:lipopolysaccharide/colanic/teichoic acid biosynthesis glycosyltransferase